MIILISVYTQNTFLLFILMTIRYLNHFIIALKINNFEYYSKTQL